MNTKQLAAMTILALCVCAIAPAQDDAVLADLVEKMGNATTADSSSYTLSVQNMTMGAGGDMETTSEMWMRDPQHYRMEDSSGTVFVVTPEGIKMRIALLNTMLEVPAETIEKLKEEERHGQLMRLGIASQDAVPDHMVNIWDALTMAGERVVGGAECWVLEGGEAMADVIKGFTSMTSAVEMDLDIEIFEMYLEKETGIYRGMHYEATMAVEGADPQFMMMELTVEELEYGIEIADEIFEYEPPEGTDVIVWTPDKEPADLGPLFGAMFALADKPAEE